MRLFSSAFEKQTTAFSAEQACVLRKAEIYLILCSKM